MKLKNLVLLLAGALAAGVAGGAFGADRVLTLVSAGDAFMVQKFPASYSVAPELKAWIASGDARLVNFECAVNDGSCPPAAWSGGTWAVMRPDVLPDLLAYGFNGCGCANNHSLDYSVEGLRMTIRALDKAGMRHSGTGKDLKEASAPAFIDTPNGRVAFISLSAEFHPDARAGLTTKLSPGRPGLNALRTKAKYFVTPAHMAAIREIAAGTMINGTRALEQEAGFILPDPPGTFVFGGITFQEAEKEGRFSWCDANDLARFRADVAAARAQADAVVVLAHSHDILKTRHCEPDHYFMEFCRAMVESGATAVIGGGTHELKGIEFYKGCPIFYSLGDFVFQNNVTPSVPPDFCEQYGVPLDSTAQVALAARSKDGKVGLHTDRANFLSVVPKIELRNGVVARVTMLPVELHFAQDWSVNGLPRPADAKAAADIEKQLATLSAAFGTEIVRLPGGILEARPKRLAEPVTPGKEWAAGDPEKHGFDAKKLAQVADYIRAQNLGTTGLMIVAGGEKIFSYGDLAEISYIASCRKSVMSMLYGNYVRNGTIKLDETVGELGIDDVGGLLPSEKRATVRDLIMARSGCYHPASNPGHKAEGLPRGKTMPNEKFVYNNWDFNVAGTVFEMKTGKNIYDAFEADLAKPLQFQDWDRRRHVRTGDATKSIHMAYHFHFSTRDMARLGELMLRRGNWGGKQLVPADWVEESLRMYSVFPEGGGYGYMWWLEADEKYPDAFRGAFDAKGMYGQHITVFPALDVVVAHKAARNAKHRVYKEQYRALLHQILAAWRGAN